MFDDDKLNQYFRLFLLAGSLGIIGLFILNSFFAIVMILRSGGEAWLEVIPLILITFFMVWLGVKVISNVE